VPDMSHAQPVNLAEVTSRGGGARQVIAGAQIFMPSLAIGMRQVHDALSDIPILTVEITHPRGALTAARIDRANLAAAGRATIAAYRNGDPDPLAYLDDELLAQGFTARGDA
jgi:hypothetical protein